MKGSVTNGIPRSQEQPQLYHLLSSAGSVATIKSFLNDEGTRASLEKDLAALQALLKQQVRECGCVGVGVGVL